MPPWGHGRFSVKKGPEKMSGLLKYENVQKLPRLVAVEFLFFGSTRLREAKNDVCDFFALVQKLP